MGYNGTLVLAILFSIFSCGGSAHAASHEIHLECLASQAPIVTRIFVSDGWSPSTGDRCIHVSADNASGEARSTVVDHGYPADCIVVPDAPMRAGIAVGVLALGLLTRRR